MYHKHKGLFVILSLLILVPLITFLAMQRKHFVISASGKIMLSNNTYDYAKSSVISNRTLVPNMTDNEEVTVECESEILFVKKIKTNKYSLICGKKVYIRQQISGTPSPTTSPLFLKNSEKN